MGRRPRSLSPLPLLICLAAAAAAVSAQNCPAGRFLSGTTCLACAPNTFSDQPNAPACTPCPANTTSPPASTACQACPAGFYINRSRECVACARNTFSNSSGATSCTSCGQGYFSSAGASACQICPAGSSMARGSCEPCPQGYFSNVPGSTSCSQCPLRYTTLAPGSDSCVLCPAGYVSISDPSAYNYRSCLRCGRMTYNPDPGLLGSDCLACPPGTTSEQGATACEDCPPGAYVDTSASISFRRCQQCPSNTYNPSARLANTSCLRCPAGSTANSGSENCTECPAGFWVNTQSSSPQYWACQQCPRNTYNPSPGYASNTSCLACPPGTVSERGSTSCNECPAGAFVDTTDREPQNRACRICPRNTYSPARYANTSCIPCPSGYSSDTNATACAICPAGRFMDTSQSAPYRLCSPCPRNTYNPTPGYANRTCLACEAGSTAEEGSTQCTTCPAGSYVDLDSSPIYRRCEACPVNTYSPRPGYADSSCVPCPEGSTAPRNSTQCTVCPAGFFVDTSDRTCKACPRQTYNPRPGLASATCMSCPPGHVSGPNATRCEPCPAGSAVRNGQCQPCSPGTYAATNASALCSPCPDGYTSRPGATAPSMCVPCRAGTYLSLDSGINRGLCRPCPENSYSDAPAAAGSCTACPERHISPAGASSAAQCVLCPPGRFYRQLDDGRVNDQCELCPANTFNTVPGLVAEACTPCPPGHTSGRGSSRCEPCPAGSFLEPSSGRCAQCPAGAFSPAPGVAACAPCPIGSTSTRQGATECTACQPDEVGFLQGGDGGLDPPRGVCGMCDPLTAAGASTCPPGEARLYGCEATNPCQPCPAGTYASPSRDFAVDACLPCPRGSISGNASLSCTGCEAGFSTDYLGAPTCRPCAPGYQGTLTTLAGGLSVGICSPCGPGAYGNQSAATTCSICPPGLTHFVQGRTDESDCRIALADPSPNVTVTEAITRREVTLPRAPAAPGPTTSYEVNKSAAVRTISLQPGAPQATGAQVLYSTKRERTVSLCSIPPPSSSAPQPLDPPEATGVESYTLYRLALRGPGGTGAAGGSSPDASPASTTSVMLVKYKDGGYSTCPLSPSGDGQQQLLVAECSRDTSTVSSPSLITTVTEAVRLELQGQSA